MLLVLDREVGEKRVRMCSKISLRFRRCSGRCRIGTWNHRRSRHRSVMHILGIALRGRRQVVRL